MSGCVDELWRLRINIFVLNMFLFFGYLPFDSSIPTVHQYVTNPTKEELNESLILPSNVESYENYPGFGESEFFYSLTVTTFSVGSIITSPLVGICTLFIPYFFLLLTGLLMQVAANLLYGLAPYAWMILLSRLLVGISFKIFKLSALTYIGSKESDYVKAYIEKQKSKEGNEEKRVKMGSGIGMKKTALIFVAISTYLPALAGPGISSVIAQISPDLFRWIGHFNTICDGFLFVILFTLFCGEYTVSYGKSKLPSCHRTTKKTGSTNYRKIIVLTFLLYSYSVWKIGIETMFILLNPVLSDSFGLTVKETGYYFTGLMVAYIAGPFILLLFNNILKVFYPRPALLAFYLMLLAGSFLIADWQTLSHDPCRIFSPFDFKNQQNISLSCDNYESQAVHSYCVSAEKGSNWTMLSEQASELCLATEGCRWNQFSVLTASLCTNCPAICHSVNSSLSIIQFSIGAVLFVMAIPLIDVCQWILLSNNLEEHEQGPFFGFANGIVGIIGTFSPIWTDALYEILKKRTVVTMALYIVLCIIALIGLVLLYRVLDPRELKTGEDANGGIEEEEEKQLLTDNDEH